MGGAAGPLRGDRSGRGGAARGVGPRGVYDMAGNVREWTVNAREPGSRYILGGGWAIRRTCSPRSTRSREFDRSPINGIRLVKRMGTERTSRAASAPIPALLRDFPRRPSGGRRDVSRLSRRMYDYDHTPLNAKVVSRDTTPPDWIREDVEFDAAAAADSHGRRALPAEACEPPYPDGRDLAGVRRVASSRDRRTCRRRTRFHRAQRPRRAVSDLRAHVRARHPSTKIEPDGDDRASRPGAALGEGAAPFGGLRLDASGYRHDAPRVRRHELGRSHGGSERSRSSRGSERPCSTSPGSRWSRCDRKRIRSTFCRASRSRC